MCTILTVTKLCIVMGYISLLIDIANELAVKQRKNYAYYFNSN